MRVPSVALPHTHQIHVVDAIRRSYEIDKDDLYGHALQDLTHGQNSAVFGEVSSLIQGAISGELEGMELEAAERTLARLHRFDDAAAYPNIFEFNRRFLNKRGLFALVTVLILDAAKVDLVTIDNFRGGEALIAAYGPRRTRRQKRLGKRLQARLKQFPVVDEPATMEAADRYVEYRFLYRGSLPEYKLRKQLEGSPRSDSYLRQWFRKFDKALGYPPPSSGRPSNRRRPSKGRPKTTSHLRPNSVAI